MQIEQKDWKPLPKPFVIDSGAGETVVPTDWCKAHAIQPSAGLGKDYYVAADGRIKYNAGKDPC